MDYSKSIFLSKTFWLQIVAVITLLLTQLSGSEFISPEVAIYITGLVIPILSVINRFFTDKPVTLKSPKQN